MFEKIFKGVPKKKFFTTIILVALIYLISFMFIRYNQEFSLLGNATNFFNSLIKTFLAAGSITAITAIILLFQSSISSQQEKKKKVFDKKIDLYDSIIKIMENIALDGKISKEEDMQILSLLARIGLLSNQKTYNSFLAFISNIKDEDGNIKDNFHNEFQDFIGFAREDLEVQDELSASQIEALNKTKAKAKEVTNKFSQPFQREYYTGYQSWRSIQLEKSPNSKDVLDIIDFFHNHINTIFENDENFRFDYAKTSGCTGYANNTKFLGINHKSGVCQITFLKDIKNDYKVPIIPSFKTGHIRSYDPYKTSTSAFGEQFKVIPDNLKSIKDKLEILTEIAKRSFEIALTPKDKFKPIIGEKNFNKATEEDLQNQKKYLSPDYTYEYKYNG